MEIIKKQLRQVQLVIFYDFWKVSNLLKIASKVDEIFREYFNGKKTVLPNDEQMPPDIPRIILNSKNGDKSLNIGPLRADFNIIDDNIEDKLDFTINKIIMLSEMSIEEFSWTINRIGAITNYIIELNIPAIDFLENDYFKKNVQEDTIKNEFNSLIRKKWQDEQINQWVRLTAEDNKLNIKIDRNLVPKERELSVTFIEKFCKEFIATQNDLIDKII